MRRDQFTFYRSYYDALKTLPLRDFKSAVLAVCAYALDEEVSELSGVPSTVFTLIRPTLDAGRNKAANRKNKARTNQEQTNNKTEQTNNKTEQTCKEGEREVEREGEVEVERENDSLKISPPVGGDTKAAAVIADYLDRVNPAASPASLEELSGYARRMGEAVCKRAFDVALDSKKATWPYIRAILRDKEARGVKCLADWDRLEKAERPSTGKGKGPKSGYYGGTGDDAEKIEGDLDWVERYLEANKHERENEP